MHTTPKSPSGNLALIPTPLQSGTLLNTLPNMPSSSNYSAMDSTPSTPVKNEAIEPIKAEPQIKPLAAAPAPVTKVLQQTYMNQSPTRVISDSSPSSSSNNYTAGYGGSPASSPSYNISSPMKPVNASISRPVSINQSPTTQVTMITTQPQLVGSPNQKARVTTTAASTTVPASTGQFVNLSDLVMCNPASTSKLSLLITAKSL